MAKAARAEEERLAPDALPGVTLPREAAILIGHAEVEAALLDAYRSARMHHAWLFAGERGIGKATLAFRLARFMFAHPNPASAEVAAARDLTVPMDHPAAHRVAVGVHGNLLHLQREWDEKRGRFKTELSVDSVRRINRFVGSTAGEGGWRVVIVDPADDMNPSAANALLKNLEEPPKQTLFILLTDSKGALLPTIRSRCRSLDLAPISPEYTLSVVRHVAPDLSAGPDTNLELSLAGGSPRRLIEIRQNDGAALYRLILAAIEAGDPIARLRLSSRAIDAAATEQILELYQGYLSRRVRGLAEPFADARPPRAPLVTWAELWEKAAFSGREVEEYNLDRRQFVLELLETTTAALRKAGIPNQP